MKVDELVREIRQGRKFLRGADLRGADLRGANLRVANLQGASLQGANLRGADLRGANLRVANLRMANLREANLQGASLRGADLREANLQGASLRGADLQEAHLQEANLDQSNPSTSKGLIWSQAGPVGTDRRTLTGAIVGAGIVLFAGCFTGTPTQFRHAVENGGDRWGWPSSGHPLERLQSECLAAVDYVERNLWLQSVKR